ncbi:22604_t:CDS:2, partial [Gigaspora margarita]
AQRDDSTDLSKIDTLKELNSKLIATIDELKKENASLRDKNTDLSTKIMELEWNAKESSENEKRSQIENSELKGRITRLYLYSIQ